MESFPVWANGQLHPPGTPVLSAEDLGFLQGLSVFDSVLFEEGCLYFLGQHIERLKRAAGELGIAWPPPWDPEEAWRQMAAAVGERDCILRMTLTRGVPGEGPSLFLTARPLVIPEDPGVVVFLSGRRKIAGDLLEGMKSTNRLRNVLAREEAQAAGAWEAILLTQDGDLAEGTLTNIFVLRDDELVTPSTERGCLSGIMREQVLSELAREPLVLDDSREIPLVSGRVEVSEIACAQEAFLTNTSGRIVPIVEVRGLAGDPHPLPGAAGPVTRALRKRVKALEQTYRASEDCCPG
ncbi:MAG: branched-subunit amino acid aminotransferase/4-amino-4-deoxychorismate lyase [Planctomycetota bacterium]|jgi:branched-subunit amino acid aminotransferase/4-amino-4-deoxychorismate lyase